MFKILSGIILAASLFTTTVLAQDVKTSDDLVFSVIKKQDMCPGSFDGFSNKDGRFIPLFQFQDYKNYKAILYVADQQTHIVFALEQQFDKNINLIKQCVLNYGGLVNLHNFSAPKIPQPSEQDNSDHL